MPSGSQCSRFFYLHINQDSNRKSRLNLTSPCIAIILEGKKQIYTDNRTEIFLKGDVVLLKPGNYLTYEIYDDVPSYESLLIFFDPQQHNFFKQRSKTSENKFEIHKADEYLKHFGKSCQMLFQDRQTMDSTAIHAVKFQEFFQYLTHRNIDFLSFFNLDDINPNDENFRQCIERYWNSTLSVEEIAFLCNKSLSSFKRVFKKAYHESPGKWLKQKRLENAAVQIKSLKRNPTEVYLESGYADYSSFSYSFKQQFGICPKEYKENIS